MRGSIWTATVVALFCLGALSVTAAPVLAADDEDDGPTVNIPGQSTDDEDSSSDSTDADSDDDNNAPEPYDGAPVDDDKDQADDDDSGPIEGHDFDSSATDLLDGTGDSGD